MFYEHCFSRRGTVPPRRQQRSNKRLLFPGSRYQMMHCALMVEIRLYLRYPSRTPSERTPRPREPAPSQQPATAMHFSFYCQLPSFCVFACPNRLPHPAAAFRKSDKHLGTATGKTAPAPRSRDGSLLKSLLHRQRPPFDAPRPTTPSPSSLCRGLPPVPAQAPAPAPAYRADTRISRGYA